MTSAADYAGLDETNLSANPNLGHSQKTLFQQFNIANFSVPQEGVRGNSGLGTVRGPGQENVDLSLAKTFPIYDRCRAEFRADAFNTLNPTQWDAVQTVYPYAAVGNYGTIPFGRSRRRTRSQDYASRAEGGILIAVRAEDLCGRSRDGQQPT